MLGTDRSGFEVRMGNDSLLQDQRRDFNPEDRHLRQLQSMENHVQKLVRDSVRVREAFFSHKIMPAIGDAKWSTETTHPTYSSEDFAEAARPFRRLFLDEIMGRFEDPL